MRRTSLVIPLGVAVATAAGGLALMLTRSTDSGPPTSVRVICDGAISKVDTRVIRAQRDGIHLILENRSQEKLSLAGAEAWAAGSPPPIWDFDTNNVVSPGFAKELVWTIAPGPVKIACRGDRQAFNKVSRLAYLRIIDVDDVYVSAELECGGAEARGFGGFRSLVPAREPLGVVRQNLTGLRLHDSIEMAEYPEQMFPAVVRVVRQGQTIAVIRLYTGRSTDIYTCGNSGLEARRPEGSGT